MNATAQHTPGKWFHEVAHERDGFGVGHIGFRILEKNRRVIAEIFTRPYPVFVNEANARLIAAAPELLDALNSMMLNVGASAIGSGMMSSLKAEPWWIAAEAAIAKATGAAS